MALIELNPFEAFNPQTPIRTIFLTSDSNLFDFTTEGITGPTATLDLDLASQLPHYVLSTGNASGVPTMRLLEATDIPNIGMTQVTGLEAAIKSIVKSLVSGNSTALSVTNNGSGDYTITPNFGTIVNKFAQGNDSRFPANVTGLRKGAGLASLDVAAVAKTDYWDTTVFVASGSSHAKGLVPDPGASAGTTKFLCEDATWKVTPAGTPANPSALVGMSAINGVAATFMRSDAAPALNPAIAPVWTGQHNFGEARTIASIAGATLDDILVSAQTTTITGSTSITTSTGFNKVSIYAPTYTDASAVTVTNAATLYVGGAPIAAGSAAITNPYALWVDSGATRLDGNLVLTGINSVLLKTGASGIVAGAVAKTDYWNTDVFVASGPSNAKGLVPAPGGSAGTSKYLREDATWQPFVPAAASITNSMLATMAAKTLKANATGSTASPTDVDAKTARSGSLLNLESITTFGNADYTALSTDRYVATSVVFTLPRTVTLPLANTFNAGQSITISDDFGAISPTNTLSIARSGADTIEGKTASMVLSDTYADVTLASNGTNGWKVIRRNPSITLRTILVNGTYTTPTGVKTLIVHCWGAGGGGGGAKASASNVAVAGGGGQGGYTVYVFNSPDASYSVTVGAGGAAGSNLGGNGGSGGDTDFGGNLATGGFGGTGDGTGGNTAATGPLGGQGGVGGGAIRVSGQPGGAGIRLSGTVGKSGAGAGAGAGQERITQGNGNDADSSGFGGAGGGGAMSSSATGFIGGVGGQGMIAVYEVY